MSDMFLNPSGGVEWRPGPRQAARMTRVGRRPISHGRLCTACLLGTWPMSMFRLSQTLCDTCYALEAEVTRRAGLDTRSRAGRFPGGSARMWGLNDAYDEDWEPIRQANAYRDGLLAKVFVEARARGLVVLEENDAGRPPSELVALADLRAHGLIPDGYADRVRRLAVWMETLDPEGFAQRSAVLADVPSLARWLSLKDRRVHQARARRELESSVAEFRRASHALVSAATGVLRAGRLAR